MDLYFQLFIVRKLVEMLGYINNIGIYVDLLIYIAIYLRTASKVLHKHTWHFSQVCGTPSSRHMLVLSAAQHRMEGVAHLVE